MNKQLLRTILQRSLFVLCSLLVINASPVYAQFTTDGINSINNGTAWYDPNFGGCGTSGSGTVSALVGNDNIDKAFHFFIDPSVGLSDFQSAGIVGNLMQESGVNPNSQQSGGPGMGIAQWSQGGRWDVLVSWVANPNNFPDHQPRSSTDLYGQLMFLLHEMKDVAPWNQTLPDMKKTTTVEDATQTFESDFEKAGLPNMPNRITYARQVLNKYGSGMSATNPTTGEAVSDCPATAGGETQYINGFTVYNQCDPAWGNLPYGSSQICPSGCGPSAMAMAITALTGQRVTPADTAAYAGAQGMYIPGSGSSWDVAPVLAKHWNLKATFIGANVTKITQALQSGAIVVGAGRGPLPFTSGGHYIAIRAVATDGKWMIGDSAHRNTSSQEWDPASLVSNMGDGSIYAISK
jgi:Phage tail lysozyme/Peptidase_C39 like family